MDRGCRLRAAGSRCSALLRSSSRRSSLVGIITLRRFPREARLPSSRPARKTATRRRSSSTTIVRSVLRSVITAPLRSTSQQRPGPRLNRCGLRRTRRFGRLFRLTSSFVPEPRLALKVGFIHLTERCSTAAARPPREEIDDEPATLGGAARLHDSSIRVGYTFRSRRGPSAGNTDVGSNRGAKPRT